MPQLSKNLKESDKFNVPNIPLLAALAKAPTVGFTSMAFNGILGTTNPKEFQKKTVDEFLFGYSDNFITMTPEISADKVGLMAGRRGYLVCIFKFRRVFTISIFQVFRWTI